MSELDYMIIPMPRAGSNLLCDLLRQANCGNPHETWGDREKNLLTVQYGKTPREAHAAYVREVCMRGGVSGIKLQPARVLNAIKSGIELRPKKIIWMRRHPLFCAVSLYKARITKAWSSIVEPQIDFSISEIHLPDLHSLAFQMVTEWIEIHDLFKKLNYQYEKYFLEYEIFEINPKKYAADIIYFIKKILHDEYNFKLSRKIQRTENDLLFIKKYIHQFDKYNEYIINQIKYSS